MRPELPISLVARNVGYTELLHIHREMFSVIQDANAPLPWWAKLHKKAVETHRSLDRQLMLATGEDLEALKERKSCS